MVKLDVGNNIFIGAVDCCAKFVQQNRRIPPNHIEALERLERHQNNINLLVDSYKAYLITYKADLRTSRK